MKLVDVIECVSYLFEYNEKMLISRDTASGKREMVNHGDIITIYHKGLRIESHDIKFFYFMPFQEGIIYNFESGGEVRTYNFQTGVKKNLFPVNHYFKPHQDRENHNQLVVVKMDELRNKTILYYDGNPINELPRRPKILFENSYAIRKDNYLKLYHLKTNELQWQFVEQRGDEYDRRNKLFLSLIHI